MKISVIICTKNRVQEPIRCIKSVIAQSLSPDELIIVDASDTKKAYLKIKEEFYQDSRFKYIHIKPLAPYSLTYQRNLGVRNSSGDIIFFLDDDTVLDKDFIKEIVKVFEKDSEKKIGGVMGDIVNIRRPQNILAYLRLLIERIFLLPTFGNGRFRSSGCPTFIHGAKEIKNVEFLSGGLTAYRKEVFKDLKFDETRIYIDDEDFSYRVSRKYQNVYTPYAKLVHNPSRIGRPRYYTIHYNRAKLTIESRYYLLRKNFPRTLKHTLAFWWSVVGYFILAITTMDRGRVKGLISGVTDIRKGQLHKLI